MILASGNEFIFGEGGYYIVCIIQWAPLLINSGFPCFIVHYGGKDYLVVQSHSCVLCKIGVSCNNPHRNE